MKKTLFALLALVSLAFTACFETETETTINANGSGTLTVMMDMSKMFDLMETMGKDSMGNMDDEPAQDSVFGFKDKAAEIEKDLGRPLTDEEKTLLDKTTGRLQLNVKEKMMKMSVRSEFTKLSQLSFLEKIQKKAMDEMPDGSDPQQGEEDEKMMELAAKPASALNFTVNDGLIENVFDKSKYQLSPEDEAMTKQIDQAAVLLGEMPVKLIYRLPRPVKNITAGARYELSEDKKTVTIQYSFLETFKDPGVQAYKIEY
jgi:hypothetical protein